MLGPPANAGDLSAPGPPAIAPQTVPQAPPTGRLAVSNPRVALLSLYEGDILNRLWSRIGLGPRRPIHVLLRALLLIAITWLPLSLLAIADPRVAPDHHADAGNFFADFAAYAQFWLGLPLFVLAEAIISIATRSASLEFAVSGVVRPRDLPLLDALHRRFVAVQRSAWSDAAALAIGYALSFAVIGTELLHPMLHRSWHTVRAGGPLTLAGYWEFLIALPLLNYWWLRHVWKVLLWWLYLRRLSRFRLDLVASHPDGTGGIGFVSSVQGHFAWLLLAYGVTNVAATVGYEIGVEGAPLSAPPVWGPVLGFVVAAPLLFLLPLFMFTRQLYRTKRSAKRLYRRRVMEQARLFEAEVLPKSADESATMSGALDLSLMAQFSKLFEAAEQMRVVPFDWRSAGQLVGSTFGSLASILPALHIQGRLSLFVILAQRAAALLGIPTH